MANGSHKQGPAMADRFRESGKKHQRALQKAIDEERESRGVELEPYRETMDSVSEVTLGKEGLKAKGFPPWLMLALLVLVALLAGFGMWLKWR